ncbi:hypothetical protein BDQ94DRAFT_155993, partial [Aspergillus welwitschiae]
SLPMPRRARHFTAFWSVPPIDCCCPGPSAFAGAREGPGLYGLGFRRLGLVRKATRSTHGCTGI